MSKRFLRAAIVIAAFLAALTSVAPAAAALRVIGKSQASGRVAITAKHVSVKQPQALYLRGYGRGLTGMTVVACSRGASFGSKSSAFSAMRSAQLYKLRMPATGNCGVLASLSGSGLIRMEILAG